MPFIYCFLGGYIIPTTLYRNLKNPLIIIPFLGSGIPSVQPSSVTSDCILRRRPKVLGCPGKLGSMVGKWVITLPFISRWNNPFTNHWSQLPGTSIRRCPVLVEISSLFSMDFPRPWRLPKSISPPTLAEKNRQEFAVQLSTLVPYDALVGDTWFSPMTLWTVGMTWRFSLRKPLPKTQEWLL